jgi:plastocyanin
MRCALLAAVAALALAPAAASAQHGDHGADPGGTTVSIAFAAFDPPFVDVLRGDRITWDNVSVRQHDVAAVDGGFISGALRGGAAFARAFDSAGEVAYFCTIHPFMRGVVGVHELLMDAPAEPAATGRPFGVRGRSALAAGTPVAIEADEGGGFAPVATASVQDDGSFSADLRPRAPAQLRAVAGAAASPPVQLLVLDRAVAASARTRRGKARVRVHVTPPGHSGMVVLQLRLRDRFGWWPVRHAELDHHGHASFSVPARRRVRARVVLTLADGATPQAVSAPLRLGRRSAPSRRCGPGCR